MAVLPPCFEPPPADARQALAAGAVHLWRLPAGTRWPILLLAHYGMTELARGPHGQPCDPTGRLALAVSDSGPWLAVAVGLRGPLGLDLECVRPLRRREALLRRCFAPSEQALLAGADDRLVLRFWTLKEAVVKAHGRGIAYGLFRVVGGLEGAWPCLQEVTGEAGPASRWASLSFELAPGCDATLVATAPMPPVRFLAPSA